MSDFPTQPLETYPAPEYTSDDPNAVENNTKAMNSNGKIGSPPALGGVPAEKPPPRSQIVIAALIRVLFVVIICLAVWVLVTIKSLSSSNADIWWSLLAGIALFAVDYAFLAKRKGKEWDWGWSPAVLIYVLVSGAAVMLTLLEFRSMMSAGSVHLQNSTITLYGASSLTLYLSYAELIQLCAGYVLLTAAVGQWMMGREKSFSAEPRFSALLMSLCQATDLAIFCYSLMLCSGASDDVYAAVFVSCGSLALLHFSFDPAHNWASPSPTYNTGSGCAKCLSNQYVRASAPLFLHEVPLLTARILLLVDPGSLFSACSIPLIYFAVSKNALCFIYLLSWMIMSGCRQCAGEGTNFSNMKSEDVENRRKRKDSANRKRIKAAIKMRNKVGNKGSYM